MDSTHRVIKIPLRHLPELVCCDKIVVSSRIYTFTDLRGMDRSLLKPKYDLLPVCHTMEMSTFATRVVCHARLLPALIYVYLHFSRASTAFPRDRSAMLAVGSSRPSLAPGERT